MEKQKEIILTQEGLKEAGLEDADDALDGCPQLLVLRGCQLGMVLLKQLQRPMGFCANKKKIDFLFFYKIKINESKSFWCRRIIFSTHKGLFASPPASPNQSNMSVTSDCNAEPCVCVRHAQLSIRKCKLLLRAQFHIDIHTEQ